MGVRRVVVRTGIVLDEDGGILKRMVPAFKMYMGGYPGKGDQFLSWIHRVDEVRAIHFLIEREDLSGVFNLTAPHPVSMKNFATRLGKALDRPAWMPIPEAALKVALGEMAQELMLTGQNVLPKRLLEAGFQFEHPTLDAAFKAVFAS